MCPTRAIPRGAIGPWCWASSRRLRRRSDGLGKCGWIFPPSPCASSIRRGFFAHFVHAFGRTRIIRPIALAGTSVRTGDRGRAAVPGWSRNGGAAWWVASPTPNPGPGDGLAGEAEGFWTRAESAERSPKDEPGPPYRRRRHRRGAWFAPHKLTERCGPRAPLPTLSSSKGQWPDGEDRAWHR